jgi:Predicted membrane protein
MQELRRQADVQEPPTAIGLEPNMGAVLSYILMVPPVMPLIMLMLEKDNKFVRFSAWQSLFFGLFVIAGIAGLEMLAFAAGHVGRPLEVLLNVLIFAAGAGSAITWFYLIIKAYQGKSVRLPVVGDEAAKRTWSTN